MASKEPGSVRGEVGLSELHGSPRTKALLGDEELPRLVLTLRDGQTCTVEREHVVDETVSRRIERVIDPHTGEARLRTLEFVEKVVEKEVTAQLRDGSGIVALQPCRANTRICCAPLCPVRHTHCRIAGSASHSRGTVLLCLSLFLHHSRPRCLVAR